MKDTQFQNDLLLTDQCIKVIELTLTVFTARSYFEVILLTYFQFQRVRQSVLTNSLHLALAGL